MPRPRLSGALRQFLIADCLVRLCEGLPAVFLVIWAIEKIRVSPSQFGLLISVLMGAAILSYLPGAAFAERAGKKSFVILTYLFFSLFPLAVSSHTPLSTWPARIFSAGCGRSASRLARL